MYTELYQSLIFKAKNENRSKSNGVYYENHHILSKHMKGDNSPENLVLLTFREHVIAHFLLWKIHGKIQDQIAYKMRSGQKEEAQRQRSKLAVEANRNGGNGFWKKGGWNPMKNPDIVKKTQETQLKKYGKLGIFSEDQYRNICEANKRMAKDPNRIQKFKESHKKFIDSITEEERRSKFGRFGESNGNFGISKGHYTVKDPEGNILTFKSQEEIIESLGVSQSFLVRNRNTGKINNQSKNPQFHKWNGWEFNYTRERNILDNN